MSYKIVVRGSLKTPEERSQIVWEPGCPLLVETFQIARNKETGRAFLQMRLRNISDAKIERYRLQYLVTFEQGKTQTLEIDKLDEDIAPGAACEPQALLLQQGDACSVIATVLSVRTANGSWEHTVEPAPLPEPAPLQQELTDAQRAERAASLNELSHGKAPEAALEHRAADHGTWWLCACGTPNVGGGPCWTCGLTPELIADLADPETLDLYAQERTDRLEREAAELARVAQRGRRLLIVAGLIAVAVAVIAFVILPGVRYLQQASVATGKGGYVIKTVTRYDSDGDAVHTKYQLDEWGNRTGSTTTVDEDYYYADTVDDGTVAYDVDINGFIIRTKPDETTDEFVTASVDAVDNTGRPTAITRTVNSPLLQEETTHVFSITYHDSGTIKEIEETDEHDRTVAHYSYDEDGLLTEHITYSYDDEYGELDEHPYISTREYDYDADESDEDDGAETVVDVESDGDKYKRFTFDENGKLSTVDDYALHGIYYHYYDYELEESYTYRYVENLSPWAYVTSQCLPYDAPLW